MDPWFPTYLDKLKTYREASVWLVSEAIGAAKINQNFSEISKCPRGHSLQIEDTIENCQIDAVKIDWIVRSSYDTEVRNEGDLHETRSDFTELDAFRF